jgi:purine-binding chemotaxis protein CheW
MGTEKTYKDIKDNSDVIIIQDDNLHRPDPVKAVDESIFEPLPGSTKALLKKRAEELAKVRNKNTKSRENIFIVEFLLGDDLYGIEASYMQEVYPLRELTPLPGTPEFIHGIINVRGKILPVMNLKKFFGLPEKGLTDLNRVLIIRKGPMETGILADDVLGVTGINPEQLQPPLATLTGIRADYLRGITPERLIVLDAERILDDPDIIVKKDI